MNVLAERLVSFIFPSRCAFCGAVVPPECRHVCEKCRSALPVAWAAKGGKRGCLAECEDCVAPFYYEGPVKKGIWRMKFGRKTDGAGVFAGFAARTVQERYKGIPFDLLAFVPLSAAEMRRRGFNQSELLARELSGRLGIPAADVLNKPRDIRPQRSCSAVERKGNVFGAFSVGSPEKVKGRNILLVDDVSTTGATLSECAKMLRLAGASKIWCVVLAKVK